MSIFFQQLQTLHAQRIRPEGRAWHYVPYDQLHVDLHPWATSAPSEVGVILVEAPAKAARRPYHKQKLALLLANQRHFALELAARGVAVRYRVARPEEAYAETLRREAEALGTIHMMRAAERELRVELAPLEREGLLVVGPHRGWLTTEEDFLFGCGEAPPWRMDAFYRQVRQRTGILMDGKRPMGGKYSFDAENRKPWRGEPPAPTPPTFRPDAVTQEVCELVEEHYAKHPGTLSPDAIAASADDAETLWRWARRECLPAFGPYEDAMSTRSTGLFHARISAHLNLHRLLPSRVVRDVASDEHLPLASREGFVRQILGWREFVRHVHLRTDGFRVLPPGSPMANAPADSGAAPRALGADAPLPPAFWGKPSGLACLDHVVQEVWQEGYSHHITRLMVLSNIATLMAIDARQLTDWFWVAYTDAYDWVVEPNVLGMGTFAVGELMTTKPYVSGAAYIHRMSDYCGACAFDPKTNCPLTRLYWAFLARHAARFAKNPRFSGPIASVRKRSQADRDTDLATFDWMRETLARGQLLDPSALRRRPT
jgi:deoxyribodipyrimidine photolyase-related protein